MRLIFPIFSTYFWFIVGIYFAVFASFIIWFRNRKKFDGSELKKLKIFCLKYSLISLTFSFSLGFLQLFSYEKRNVFLTNFDPKDPINLISNSLLVLASVLLFFYFVMLGGSKQFVKYGVFRAHSFGSKIKSESVVKFIVLVFTFLLLFNVFVLRFKF